MKIIYPPAEKIEELNLLVLALIKVKKSDKPELLSTLKLVAVLNECTSLEGDIYDKAVVLLKGIIQKHPFASGNRRTAFVATKYFLEMNKEKFKIDPSENQFKVFLGIRENYYTCQEIKEWIKNGKIREFRR